MMGCSFSSSQKALTVQQMTEETRPEQQVRATTAFERQDVFPSPWVLSLQEATSAACLLQGLPKNDPIATPGVMVWLPQPSDN